MDRKLTLAVAGSGKTYAIAHSIKEDEKNVIFTFNVRNVENLKREIIKRFGYIPQNTQIMTFHIFRYKYFVKPNQYNLGDRENIELKGIDIISTPPSRPNPRKGIYNTGYVSDSEINHYITNNKVYSDYMSKLIIKKKLYKNAKEYIQTFVDSIYIDEFQDFEFYDYDILKHLNKFNVNLYAYGDYYQAGVSYSCSMIKRPYNKESYKDYIEIIKNDFKGITIDNKTLSKSRRCGESVTNLINERFAEDIIFSSNQYKTKVLEKTDLQLIDKKKLTQNLVVDDYRFIVWDKTVAAKYELSEFVTWSRSKGDTYSKACLILTKEASNFMIGNNSKIKKTSKNKLYVALTRASDELVIIYD